MVVGELSPPMGSSQCHGIDAECAWGFWQQQVVSRAGAEREEIGETGVAGWGSVERAGSVSRVGSLDSPLVG